MHSHTNTHAHFIMGTCTMFYITTMIFILLPLNPTPTVNNIHFYIFKILDPMSFINHIPHRDQNNIPTRQRFCHCYQCGDIGSPQCKE